MLISLSFLIEFVLRGCQSRLSVHLLAYIPYPSIFGCLVCVLLQVAKCKGKADSAVTPCQQGTVVQAVKVHNPGWFQSTVWAKPWRVVLTRT